jgi:hypothetical protein
MKLLPIFPGLFVVSIFPVVASCQPAADQGAMNNFMAYSCDYYGTSETLLKALVPTANRLNMKIDSGELLKGGPGTGITIDGGSLVISIVYRPNLQRVDFFAAKSTSPDEKDFDSSKLVFSSIDSKNCKKVI